MKIEIQSVEACDGEQTIIVTPMVSRRQKANWQLWIKSDGRGQVSIDTTLQRIELPANSNREDE